MRIYGETVDFGGWIRGTEGGQGGNASTDNSAPTNRQKALDSIFPLRGRASAAGGIGGFGGSALEVFIDYFVEGGWGASGAYGWARGYTSPTMSPGGASAWGGDGGKGGTVIFNNCVVRSMGKVLEGGGGGGASGDASAGDGADHWFGGGRGGSATAKGGNGGSLGAAPVVPLGPGVVAPRVAPANVPTPGGGGDATAAPGAGGDATVAGSGGSSGTGVAQGGSNGASVGPGPAKAPPATPAAGKIGGASVPSNAFQPGVP